jgi:sugar phosphate isomerase/epimerase
MAEGLTFTVFTKPWKEPLPSLAKKLSGLGFGGVELAIRPGYQVEPHDVVNGLPAAARILADHGLVIGSVAASTDEATIAACGEAGIPIIRICVGIDMKIGYLASVDKVRREFDSLIPVLERHGVAIGVQNHCDFCVGSAVGLLHLIEQYDPKQVCAVLDMAHCAVDGEPVEMAVDILWPRMNRLINFKSAYHRRVNGPEEEAVYNVHWTTAQHSGYSWRKLVSCLRARAYTGTICLPAEYSNANEQGQLMGDDVIPYLRQDLNYIRQLFDQDSVEPALRTTDWQASHRAVAGTV